MTKKCAAVLGIPMLIVIFIGATVTKGETRGIALSDAQIEKIGRASCRERV